MKVDVPVPRFRLSLLARFALSGPDGLVDLPNRKVAGLLAYLACTAGLPQSREKLATLLWGSHFETQAQQNLRQALFRLRRLLGADVIVGDGDQIRLAPGAVDCDVARLQALIGEGSTASLTAAADLYQGGLLSDLNIAQEAWADWLDTERARLEGLALDAMIHLAERELAEGGAEAALKAASRAIAVNPLREDAHRLVVQALAAAGRKPEALRHYQHLVALLKRELSTEPDVATRSLVANLDSIRPSSRPLPLAARLAPKAAPREAAAVAADRANALERRQLTVMACNLVQPDEFKTRLDPEDMHELIAAFHRTIVATVSPFGGYVAQYLGDGVQVYFGYPAAHEHDAEQAVRAARALLDATGALKAPQGIALQASAGIATGLVVVGERTGVGETPQRVAIGEAPNLAAQLQTAAGGGEIVIAGSTRELVGESFDCRTSDPALPADAWLVTGERVGVSRFAARRADMALPLVGRQEELDLLKRRFDQAKQGEGRVVLISGEPGVGKSRIAESLLLGLSSEPHATLRYFCSPHHMQSPFYPFIVQLERSFEPGSTPAARLARLEQLFKPTSIDLARDVALVAELLAIPLDGRYAARALTPQQKRELTLTALVNQLEGVAAEGPVVILVEDVHWIDPTSLDLLNRAVARAAALPLLLVITFRPELQPAWLGESHVTLLPLNRLDRRDSTAMVGGVARGKAMPEAVVEQVLAHADGVPLFIEELTNALLESGSLRETADAYAVDGALPKLAVPTTLQASLVARLDRLGPARDVALIGAAIGREFSHELVAALSASPPADLDAALERLTASGLISRRGAPPEASYMFKHALVQDAAYATMLRSRRRQLHAEIGKTLVERFPATIERLPEVAARHFTEAGLVSEAIGYWRMAGQLAGSRSASAEAATSFEQALELLKTLPESQLTLEQGCDIRLELRPVLLELSRGQRMLECMREAGVLAERLDDDRRRGRVDAFMTVMHSLRGEMDAALATGTRALAAAERLDDLKTRIVTTSLLVQVHHVRAEYDRAIELGTGNLAVLPPEWMHETLGLGGPPAVWDRGCMAMSLADCGRFAEATQYAGEAIGIAEQTQHVFIITMAYFAASVLHLVRGDWSEARSRIDRWLAVAQAGHSLYLPWGIALSAWPLAQLGEASEALNRITEGETLLDRQAASGVVANRAWFFAALARASLQLGAREEARRLAGRALECCVSQPGFRAYATLVLGDAAAHPDGFDADTATTIYMDALMLAGRLQMRPLAAHCHLGLGRVQARLGRADRGRGQLEQAIAMYREMDMPFWLATAKAAFPQAKRAARK
jgi:DNA-binding SARP family transcriptional activator